MDKNAHQSNVAPAPTSSWWLPVVLERAHRHCGSLPIPGSVAVPRRHGPMPPPRRSCCLRAWRAAAAARSGTARGPWPTPSPPCSWAPPRRGAAGSAGSACSSRRPLRGPHAGSRTGPGSGRAFPGDGVTGECPRPWCARLISEDDGACAVASSRRRAAPCRSPASSRARGGP